MIQASELYPMGDRGGTATISLSISSIINYTRWEIGGEPQQETGVIPGIEIIPDGRSGGNRNDGDTDFDGDTLYPMGDRGGTATGWRDSRRRLPLYPMGDRGGTATNAPSTSPHPQLYPMGDRGGTATPLIVSATIVDYTRWEIGGEPQR